MRFVHIKFRDASRDTGWILKSDWEKGSLICHAVGVVIHEDKESITVTSVSADSSYFSPITIPKVAIIEQHKLVAKE